MSVAEIIGGIPSLTEAERRIIREVMVEIANRNPQVAACNQTACDGARMLDRVEDEDGSVATGSQQAVRLARG